MTTELNELIEKSRQLGMTAGEKEAQRRSFAYGSAKIENEYVTREMVDNAAQKIGLASGKQR